MSEFHYGGQAVLEGVMMRGQKQMAVAVRAPDGKIVVDEHPLDSGIYVSKWAKLPLVRGLVMLWDQLGLGYRALMFSANIALPDDEQEFTTGTMVGTVLVSLLFVVGIFFLLPMFLVELVDKYISSSVLSTSLEGLLRLLLFAGYLAAVSLLPDIRRVFAYHGAEHKTVNAYEGGVELVPEEVERYSTAHTRCGTSFLLVVIVIYVVITVLMGRPSVWVRLLSRIVLIPIVAGISYEWLKFSAVHYDRPLVRLLAAPGLAIQRLSTREPDRDMIEVAIVALKRVISADGIGGRTDTEVAGAAQAAGAAEAGDAVEAAGAAPTAAG
jgi:uncharacterized protein YqhQ